MELEDIGLGAPAKVEVEFQAAKVEGCKSDMIGTLKIGHGMAEVEVGEHSNMEVAGFVEVAGSVVVEVGLASRTGVGRELAEVVERMEGRAKGS